MKYLTTDEHRRVVERLVRLTRSAQGVHVHTGGIGYTSLMACFLMHSTSVAQSLLALHKEHGNDWYPVTTGYLIVRSLFEVDVNAHYITADPTARSQRYIDFERVIEKNTLEAVERHRASPSSSWREGLQLTYTTEYAPRKAKIETDYDAVKSTFEDAKGKRATTWSGKTLRAMAKDVNHIEAYDIFYADLSSFTHVNVKLANRFLRPDGIKSGAPLWTQRPSEFDVANVFRYAATFLTCFLELFGGQFNTWTSAQVGECWDFPEADGRKPRNVPPTGIC